MRSVRLAVMVLAIAALAVVSAAPASATKAPHARLWLAAGHLSGPVDLDTGDYHMSGTEFGLHEGKVTVVVDGTAVPDDAHTTATTANGDTITSELGPNLATDPGRCRTDLGVASGAFTFDATFTGGTGRFAGASGHDTVSGCFRVDVDPATGVATQSVTYVGVGSISY